MSQRQIAATGRPGRSAVVSVITVCRDSESTIRGAIQSVVDQTYEPIEYVVVDGASRDATLDMVREYEPQFGGRLRWISEHDAGIYDAMNKGIRLASGEFVIFLNSDDWFVRDGVETLAGALSANPSVDLIYGGMLRPPSGAGGAPRICPPGEMSLDPLMRAMPTCHEAILFRRDLHARFGDYSLAYPVAADYEFLLRCLRGGASSVRVDAPVVFYSAGGASDRDAATVEREYARVRVLYGANRALERFRSERRILTGRVFRLATRVPLLGRLVNSAYHRSECRER